MQLIDLNGYCLGQSRQEPDGLLWWNSRTCCCYFHVSFVGLMLNRSVKNRAVSPVGVLFCPLLFPKSHLVLIVVGAASILQNPVVMRRCGGGIAVVLLPLGASHAEHVAEWRILRCASIHLFPTSTSFPQGKHSLLQIPSSGCSRGHSVSH